MTERRRWKPEEKLAIIIWFHGESRNAYLLSMIDFYTERLSATAQEMM
jgi:hypothetical protein